MLSVPSIKKLSRGSALFEKNPRTTFRLSPSKRVPSEVSSSHDSSTQCPSLVPDSFRCLTALGHLPCLSNLGPTVLLHKLPGSHVLFENVPDFFLCSNRISASSPTFFNCRRQSAKSAPFHLVHFVLTFQCLPLASTHVPVLDLFSSFCATTLSFLSCAVLLHGTLFVN